MADAWLKHKGILYISPPFWPDFHAISKTKRRAERKFAAPQEKKIKKKEKPKRRNDVPDGLCNTVYLIDKRKYRKASW